MRSEQQELQMEIEDCAGIIIQNFKQLPTHYLQIKCDCASHPGKHLQVEHLPSKMSQIQERIHQINKQAIQIKFIEMIDKILDGIQLKLKKENGNWKQFNEFDQIVNKNLLRDVYPQGLKASAKKAKSETPTQTPKSVALLTEDQKAQHADQFFSYLFETMHHLLAIMKSNYGYENDDQLEIAMYTALINFMQKNQQSFIVVEDKLSMSRISSERNSREESQEKQKSQKSYLHLIYDTVSNTIPQAVSEIPKLPGFIVNNIKDKYSVLSSKSQKQKVKHQLISLLSKSSQKKAEDYQIPKDQVKLIDVYMGYDIQKIFEEMKEEDRKDFIDFVSDVMTQPEWEEFMEQTKAYEEISQLIDTGFNIKEKGKAIEKIQVLWVILLYKAFQKNYCSSRRQYIMSLCNKQKIKSRLKKPTQILKMIESYYLIETQLMKQIRSLPVINQKQQLKKMNHKKTDDFSLHLEHQLHRIHLYQLKKKYDKPVNIQFYKLSACAPKKNITLLFSGFLSQDSCKLEEWSELVKTAFDSEIYSVRWESKSLTDFSSYIYDSGRDIFSANIGIATLAAGPYGPYLRAAAIVKQIYNKYKENPFNPAFDCAQATGQFFAELLISSFQGHFINLVGFSLGTEVISCILQRLSQRGHIHLINRIYFLGGVADKPTLQKLLQSQQKHILRIRNMHSDNDSILRYLLKITKPNIVPIGLNPLSQNINKHKIKNIDGSSVISGHLSYRENLNIIEMMMQIHD